MRPDAPLSSGLTSKTPGAAAGLSKVHKKFSDHSRRGLWPGQRRNPGNPGTPPDQVPQFGEHSRRAIALKNTLLIWAGLVT